MSSAESHNFGNPPPFGNPYLAQAFGIPPPPAQDPPMLQYRGHTLAQPFDLRARMKVSREKPMVGVWYGAFMCASLGRIMGQMGYDFVLLDWEHTPMSIGEVIDLIKTIQYAGEGKTAVIVRVPNHDHHYAAWVLDAGASAVIFPHVETVEQAKDAVKHARFPAHGGIRSGPPNAMAYGVNDGAPNHGGMVEQFGKAAVILQIESEAGCNNADAIAAVPGVDGLMLGPGDLALDLGIGMDKLYQDEKWNCLTRQVIDAAKKHDLASMMPGFFGATAGINLDWGFTMVMAGNEGIIVTRALRNELEGVHKSLREWKGKGEGGNLKPEEDKGE